MLITLTVLSLLCCYQEAVAEGGANRSIHQRNGSIAPSASTSSNSRPATNSTVRPTTPKSTLNVNNSNTPNKPKNSVNITLHEHDIPFFSADFKNRLATWKKLLQNTSRHCIEPNYTNQRPIEIDFPVFGVKEDVEDGFLPLETILPVLVRRRKKHDLVQIAYMAILELWPLLVLCFSCAALSGILVWILDSRSNPEQFPKRFWRGIFDGIWWAIVTMTTVGYGDKTPRSLLARLFAIVWMVSGIILLSMFTAQVSSRLTAQELRSDHHLFGKKVGVPPSLYGSDYVDYKMTYSRVEEIENETALDHSDQLDSIVIFHCDGKKEKDWEVLQFMPACQVGAKVNFRIHTPSSDEYRKIDTELNDLRCLKMRTARKYMTYSQESHGSETKMHRTCNEFLEKQDNRKFEFKWVYFTDLSQYLIPFGAVVGAIVLAFIIGAIWECRKRGKKSGKFNSSSTNIAGVIKSCD
ncbi:unnamed protein product [Porites evermanni]|uniref:Potassium channel domain-containing protein n=1 Tax=Porites evermanni TaxID=104178 RepID=A0ABN8LJA1_9CNID|nr:unnamed protein product [Porites evermanni]